MASTSPNTRSRRCAPTSLPSPGRGRSPIRCRERYDLIVSIEVLEHLPRPVDRGGGSAVSARSLTTSCSRRRQQGIQRDDALQRAAAGVLGRLVLAPGLRARDVDCDASFITSWAVRFQHRSVTMQRLVHDYERRFYPVWKENAELRSLVNELRGRMVDGRTRARRPARERDRGAEGARGDGAALRPRSSTACRGGCVKAILPPIQRALPRNSLGGRLVASALEMSGAGLGRARQAADALRSVDASGLFKKIGGRSGRKFPVPPLAVAPPLTAHAASVDVIVCVHNALEDVTSLLIVQSCARRVRPMASSSSTTAATRRPATTWRASPPSKARHCTATTPRSATRAPPIRGCAPATADCALLLNSDTIVPPDGSIV